MYDWSSVTVPWDLEVYKSKNQQHDSNKRDVLDVSIMVEKETS